MFNKALYYPWIVINDMGWLKTSALYWEEISTIVPASYGKPFHEIETRMLEEEGILKPFIVRSSTTSSATFRNEVIKYFDNYEGYYARALRDQTQVRMRNRIYWEKIDGELHSFIKARLNKYNEDYFMADDYFADFYMTLLANHISRRNGMSLITDTPILNRVGIEISNAENLRHPYFPRRTEYNERDIENLYESMLANLSFKQIGVSSDTDMKKIIKYRNKYTDYIGRYRCELKELTKSLKEEQFETIEALNSAIDAIVKNKITPALDDLRKGLKDEQIKTLLAPITITGVIGVATSFLLNPGITLGTAGLTITAQALISKRKINAKLRENNFAYLQLMDKVF